MPVQNQMCKKETIPTAVAAAKINYKLRHAESDPILCSFFRISFSGRFALCLHKSDDMYMAKRASQMMHQPLLYKILFKF